MLSVMGEDSLSIRHLTTTMVAGVTSCLLVNTSAVVVSLWRVGFFQFYDELY